MTISTSTADQLEALANTIFSQQTMTGLTGQDSATDAQLSSLITEAMKAIDGRDLAQGFMYTLNITNALQLRPKHWYMEIDEYNTNNPNVSAKVPCFCGLELVGNQPTGYSYWVNSYGMTIGLATCGAICNAWARIIRLWIAGNYPPAVNPYVA